jgi:hypothetical protein
MAEASGNVQKAPVTKRGPKGVDLKAKIFLGETDKLDKDGKPTGEKVKFGAKNNPKREGTKAAERFTHYRDGMTVEKALEYMKPRHITRDADKKYIRIEAPAAA